MRVVLDSNVLLSGFATGGLCEALVEICLGKHELVACESILAEVKRHLAGKFNLSAERVEDTIRYLSTVCVIVEPLDVPIDACRDPDDLMVLGTALAGRVEVIVSGDKDLLSLGNFEGIAIVSPRAFYQHLT